MPYSQKLKTDVTQYLDNLETKGDYSDLDLHQAKVAAAEYLLYRLTRDQPINKEDLIMNDTEWKNYRQYRTLMWKQFQPGGTLHDLFNRACDESKKSFKVEEMKADFNVTEEGPWLKINVGSGRTIAIECLLQMCYKFEDGISGMEDVYQMCLYGKSAKLGITFTLFDNGQRLRKAGIDLYGQLPPLQASAASPSIPSVIAAPTSTTTTTGVGQTVRLSQQLLMGWGYYPAQRIQPPMYCPH